LYTIELPAVLGLEAAGEVDEVGEGVTEPRVGERVAFAAAPGSYAEYVVLPAWQAVGVPDGISSESAAAVMLQGMTAHYLSHSTVPLEPVHTALILAAAGGVGQLLVQMAKRRGARVIAAASTDEKERIARSRGADDVIRYTEVDLDAEARRLTDDVGVDVVYDSVGKDTFEKSLASLKPRGYLVLYGQASGPVGKIDPQILNAGGSLFLTRPSLGHYTATREELTKRAGDLFSWMKADELDVAIDTVFPLADAAEAHRYIEARKTKGKVLLKP
jgi:NADPH2:quinone reductase